MMDVFNADERMRNLFIRSFVGCVAWELKEFESSTMHDRERRKTTYLRVSSRDQKAKVDDALLIM